MAFIAKNGTFSLERGTGDPMTFSVIPGVKSFDPGAISTEQIDVTDFDSTGNYREFASGYSEASDGSFVLNYDPDDSVHKSLRESQGSGNIETLKATYNGSAMTLKVLISGFSTPVSVGGVMEATVTIKMTGDPELPGEAA